MSGFLRDRRLGIDHLSFQEKMEYLDEQVAIIRKNELEARQKKIQAQLKQPQ